MLIIGVIIIVILGIVILAFVLHKKSNDSCCHWKMTKDMACKSGGETAGCGAAEENLAQCCDNHPESAGCEDKPGCWTI